MAVCNRLSAKACLIATGLLLTSYICLVRAWRSSCKISNTAQKAPGKKLTGPQSLPPIWKDGDASLNVCPCQEASAQLEYSCMFGCCSITLAAPKLLDNAPRARSGDYLVGTLVAVVSACLHAALGL